jgi:hypothetical protein
MMLRQEAALDRSIDRKVRILLRLRKELSSPPVAPGGQDDDARKKNVDEALDSAIVSDDSQRVETVENLKVTDQCGNVYENKGSACSSPAQSGNVAENKGGRQYVVGGRWGRAGRRRHSSRCPELRLIMGNSLGGLLLRFALCVLPFDLLLSSASARTRQRAKGKTQKAKPPHTTYHLPHTVGR